MTTSIRHRLDLPGRRLGRAVVAGAALAALWTAPASAREGDLTQEQISAIDRYVPAEMARQHIPGAVVGVYRRGRMVFAQGYGYAILEWQVPMRADAIFQSGSVGKQFTATAVMMLVEQGKVGLDDSLLKYFPEGPGRWGDIQVKNLLSHSSGLAEYEDDGRTRPGGPFDLRLDFTEDQLVQKVAALPIDWPPGTRYGYRNTNYMLLGVLIHRVSGLFYGDYLQEHVFRPLGMRSTRIISDRDIIAYRVAGYEMDGDTLKNQAFVSPTFNSTGDGALYFNLPDLEKWDRAQYGDGILTPAMKQRMWTPFILKDGKPNPGRYGFAFFIDEVNGHRVVEHTGAWQGFTTVVSRYVDDELSVAILTNLDSVHANPKNMERVVAGLVEPTVMPALHKGMPDDRPALAATARKLVTEIEDGRDASFLFEPGSSYRFDAGDAVELKFMLPRGWRDEPWELVKRVAETDSITSGYRLGYAGDYRMLVVQTSPDGRVRSYQVMADPDNR